ncbi:MAG: quinone-dependent dihydroorotate dehydrogenase [Pseudomonadota bacterium]
MSVLDRLSLGLLHTLEPERAHDLALAALRTGLVPMPGQVTTPRLRCELAGITLPNPVGLAAGFDKNAVAVRPLSRAGFGFIEAGAITPKPQPGNPRPRLFRLTEDRAVINRFGFNNVGMEAAVKRLAKRPKEAVLGLNLGANKNSADRAEDYALVLARCGPYIDFATVNVSSPNTQDLRKLQSGPALAALLSGVMEARDWLERRIPIFLKIAPDLERDALAEIVDVARLSGIAAIIATNTTLDRKGLQSDQSGEAGGLSGAPLFEKSTRILAQLADLTEGGLPLIGVGGVSSGAEAYTKIKAGASAVQLYSALVYGGMGLAARIAHELDALLAADGVGNVADCVGIERDKWI